MFNLKWIYYEAKQNFEIRWPWTATSTHVHQQIYSSAERYFERNIEEFDAELCRDKRKMRHNH